jgi:DNA-binding NtrC family response regulator
VPVGIKYHPRRRSEPTTDHPGRLPLASGGELSIVPQQTMDARWESMLREIWRYVERENARFESEQASRAEGLILASSVIRRVHRQVLEAAQRGARLMLVGPSGVGKEGLARAFHRHSGRVGAFVPRNCAMFTKELVRAELFGAEPGAYTGATRRIVGAIERAHGGTLFLDELGEMPIDVQPTLLRFLDRGEFERLGDYGTVRLADVRLVAATNRDLRLALERNEFRADLWYRISNDVIELPPLRERFEDVRAFLKTQLVGNSGETAFDLLSPAAEALLREHRWDGNFRELQSFASRLLASPSGPIDGATCRELLARGTLSRVPSAKSGPTLAGDDSNREWLKLVERAALAFAEDVGHEMPEDWDEVKEFVEKYFKPLLFVQLGHGASAVSKDDIDVSALARRLGADRGTAARQIERYLELLSR